MSQLFESLRRNRKTPAQAKTPRTPHGDAVLATLGYAPVRRRRGFSPSILQAAALLAVLGACWIGWRVYDRPASDLPLARSVQTSASTSKPVSPAGPRPVPSAPQPLPSSATAVPPGPVVTGTQAPVVAAPRPLPRLPAASTLPVTRPETAAPASPAAANDLELALYYHRAGDFENALQHYRALLQTNELNAQAHNNLGLLYQEKNLLQESARELQRAVLIEPRNVGAHNNYGVTLLMQGKVDAAVAEFRSALSLDSRNLDALVNLALAQRTTGQLDVAKETLLSALTIQPRNPPAHYNLAQLYDQTNETAGAVEHYRKFLETAGAEHAGRVAAVRARIAALSRTPE